jgi:aldehyde:ferredoxin oxidoreductase
MDSLILCKFLRGVFSDFYAEAAEMLRLVTGWDVTADELRTTARRIVASRKLFNISAGWTAAEDTLPPRLLDRALADDPDALLSREALHAAVAAYNTGRDWTKAGVIPSDQLATLGLADL